MSFVFDTMQNALSSLKGDGSVIKCLRWMIDDLHNVDHEQRGALNRRMPLAMQATELEKILERIAKEEAR